MTAQLQAMGRWQPSQMTCQNRICLQAPQTPPGLTCTGIQTISPWTQVCRCHGAEGHCHSVKFRSLWHWILSTLEVPKIVWTGLLSSQPCPSQPSCLQMMDKDVSFRALLHTAPQAPL